MFKPEDRVWIKNAKSKGIVKEVNYKEKKYKVTFYSPNDKNKRITTWLKVEQLRKYRDHRSQKPLEIKIKYFTDIEKVKPISVGDWVDLRAAEDVELKAGEYKLIPLGVGMKLPPGFEANIVPRSSTFKNWGILQTNSFGVIDNSYSGENDQYHFPAYATRDTVIKKNDRICQFRIQHIMPKVKFTEVEKLDEVSRGGIGSTGTN